MKTKNETMRYKAEDFLADVDFTMWALNPDKGAGDFWSGYVSRFPENREEFEKAMRSAKSVRFNHCEADPDRKVRLRERIMAEYRSRLRRRTRRRRELFIYACAACVVAAFAGVALRSAGRQQLCDPSSPERLAAARNITFTSGGKSYEADCDMMQIYCMSDGRISIVGGGERVVRPVRRTVNELLVPEGRKAFVTLSDGSTVWVNSGTVVRFPSLFERHRRRMFVEGEVYVDVARREEAPFTLFSGGGNSVRVLGTRFGVKSSGRHGSYSVVLEEGSVEVNIADRECLKLAPSQLFSYCNGSYAVRTVDTDEYLRWKDGILLFSTDSLQEILSQIARTYGVEIVSDSLIGDMKCSGKLIISDNLDNTLEVLSDIIPIDWVHTGDRVEIRAR